MFPAGGGALAPREWGHLCVVSTQESGYNHCVPAPGQCRLTHMLRAHTGVCPPANRPSTQHSWQLTALHRGWSISGFRGWVGRTLFHGVDQLLPPPYPLLMARWPIRLQTRAPTVGGPPAPFSLPHPQLGSAPGFHGLHGARDPDTCCLSRLHSPKRSVRLSYAPPSDPSPGHSLGSPTDTVRRGQPYSNCGPYRDLPDGSRS